MRLRKRLLLLLLLLLGRPGNVGAGMPGKRAGQGLGRRGRHGRRLPRGRRGRICHAVLVPKPRVLLLAVRLRLRMRLHMRLHLLSVHGTLLVLVGKGGRLLLRCRCLSAGSGSACRWLRRL